MYVHNNCCLKKFAEEYFIENEIVIRTQVQVSLEVCLCCTWY